SQGFSFWFNLTAVRCGESEYARRSLTADLITSSLSVISLNLSPLSTRTAHVPVDLQHPPGPQSSPLLFSSQLMNIPRCSFASQSHKLPTRKRSAPCARSAAHDS